MVSASEKITELKQKSKRILQKSAMVGLFSLTTASSLGAQNQETPEKIKTKAQTETSLAAADCAYYLNNVTLNADSPIEQIYKVDKCKAFYSHYLNGGKGGIVFTKYLISDADLFAKANLTSASELEKTLKTFAELASNFKYKGEIKCLDDVQKCLDSYATSERKKDQHIGEILSTRGNRLISGLSLKKKIAEMNEANIKSAKHEQIHASIGSFINAIDVGDVMLAPEGIYLARMADELRAQIKGGDIAATEQGVEDFFSIYGAGYKELYTSDILKDNSYKRMFAYSLSEEKADINLPAEINNLFLGFDSDGIDNHGNSCTVNGVETERGYVFFGNPNASEAKMKNGRILPLNCLVDEQGKVIKDKDGKIQPAQVVYHDGNFTATVSGSVLSTKVMDKNLKDALSHILNDLDDSAKKLVLKSLDKHCKADAKQLTNTLLCDHEGMMQLRSETDSAHIGSDLKYIKEKRKVFLQEIGEKNLSSLNLIRMTSPHESTSQFNTAVFKQITSEKN